MEPRNDRYRVRLLGELEVFTPEGEQLTFPTDRVMKRLLIAMALRAGQPRRTDDLVAAVWPGPKSFGRDARNLETPTSRLRSKLGLPIPPRRSDGFYKLDLQRTQVDALDFIDRMRGDDVDHRELDELLGMWRGNPRVLYSDLPNTEWGELVRGLDQLFSRLSKLTPRELNELEHFRTFAELFPDETSALRPVDTRNGRSGHRILIVENEIEIAKTMAAILFEHDCVIAITLEEAMSVLTNSDDDLDGAVIDLHLTDRLDSAGLEILSYIRDRRPGIPRMLITASPPAGSQEQMRKTYGLFDIVVKGADGYSANGVREAVSHMLGEEEEDVRRRATALFESHSVRAQRALTRRLIAARRAMRAGRSEAYAEIDHWSALIEHFEDQSDTVRDRLASVPAHLLDSTVDEFVGHWRQILGDEGAPPGTEGQGGK
jgi:DNA-binding response OmpR family regulator